LFDDELRAETPGYVETQLHHWIRRAVPLYYRRAAQKVVFLIGFTVLHLWETAAIEAPETTVESTD
jgi:hypothetical protein